MNRVQNLVEYLRLLHEGPVRRDVFETYRPALSAASAREVNEALDEVLDLAAGEGAEALHRWKTPVARFIRSVSSSLDAAPLPDYPEDSVFASLERENAAIETELSNLRPLIPAPRNAEAGTTAEEARAIESIKTSLGSSNLLRDHYTRLQNELFPLFEKAQAKHACVSLMWAIQDDVLELRRELIESECTRNRFLELLGGFYVTSGMLLYRERRILYPVVYEALKTGSIPSGRATEMADAGSVFSTRTGSLGQRELEAIFKILPLDISFIGTDDRVKFYSDPPHRIFPRSPEVIGRHVQKCHPPKSVATVEEILRSFKSGARDSAEFWLQKAGALIHIRYLALRDPDGIYLGTLEVSQDATELRALEGERRLLQWK